MEASKEVSVRVGVGILDAEMDLELDRGSRKGERWKNQADTVAPTSQVLTSIWIRTCNVDGIDSAQIMWSKSKTFWMNGIASCNSSVISNQGVALLLYTCRDKSDTSKNIWL